MAATMRGGPRRDGNERRGTSRSRRGSNTVLAAPLACVCVLLLALFVGERVVHADSSPFSSVPDRGPAGASGSLAAAKWDAFWDSSGGDEAPAEDDAAMEEDSAMDDAEDDTGGGQKSRGRWGSMGAFERAMSFFSSDDEGDAGTGNLASTGGGGETGNLASTSGGDETGDLTSTSGGDETGNLTSTSCGPGNCGTETDTCRQCPDDCCDYGTTGCCYGATNCGVYGDDVCSVPDRANCDSMPPDSDTCTIPPECNCDYGTTGCCWGDGSAQCGGKKYGCRNFEGKGKCVPI